MADVVRGIEEADNLQGIIERQQSLTTVHETWVQSDIRMWAALREADEGSLREMAEWDSDRTYVVDPLAGKISEAFADLLFSEDPTVTAAETVESQARAQELRDQQRAAEADGAGDEAAVEGPDRNSPPEDDDDGDGTDQDRLDNIVEANDLGSELREAAKLSSSEGEVWWRIYTDESQSDYPIIEWYSRSHVRPLFRGRKLVAAAFYAEIFREEIEDQWSVWRWVTIYSEGHVRNLLYQGTPTALGTKKVLTDRPETKPLRELWDHGFDMLAGRVPNRLGRDRRVGISDYKGIKSLLFSLNEATTIGHENMRLTAKKRAVVPASALQQDGKFDASEDVLVADEELDVELGRAASSKFAILEYSFDAQSLIAHIDYLSTTILTRVGVSEQFTQVTASPAGLGESGVARKVRLLPTTLAASGKARHWDDALPKVLMLAQLVDKDQFNRPWTKPGEMPVVERGEPLPEDEAEEVTRHAAAVTAEIESRRTAIKDLHPDWDEEQVDDELDQIKRELDEFGVAKGPVPPGGAPNPLDPGGDGEPIPPETPAPETPAPELAAGASGNGGAP